jgi:hypothetical protein
MCSTLVESIETAVAALEEALAADPHSLADETLRQLMPTLQRARNLLDATDVRLVGVFHAKKLGEADALTTIQWLTHKTRVPTADARERINAAASLRHLPHTEAAFAAGRIGKAQVLALARVDTERTAEKLEEGEPYLVEHAAADDFATFERILRAWKLAADPDGPEPRVPRRRFDLRRGPDGEWEGRLFAPADEGAAIDAALAPFERIEWQRDWDEARRIHGVNASAHHLPRTASERRLAALHALVSRGAGSPDGTREPKPLVNIVVTQAAFERALAQAAGLPVDPLDPTKAHEFDCRLIDGTPIDAETMLRHALTGFVRRVVIQSPGIITDIGRRQRLFTGPMRHAILSLVPHCGFPGCTVPARNCEVDHRHRWRHGGLTEPHNGAPLCDRHQKLKERGFTDRQNPDGTWTWHRPDGTRLE